MLGPYRAGSRRLGRRHGVTPRGLAGSRSRPGCHRRVAIGRPADAHHIDRRRFARNRRASCDGKAAQSQYDSGTGFAVPARSAVDHFPLLARPPTSKKVTLGQKRARTVARLPAPCRDAASVSRLCVRSSAERPNRSPSVPAERRAGEEAAVIPDLPMDTQIATAYPVSRQHPRRVVPFAGIRR